jgi:hypothetical protein
VFIMQQQEGSTSQDRRETPHQSSRDQRLRVHRLVVTIDVEGGGPIATLLCPRIAQRATKK